MSEMIERVARVLALTENKRQIESGGDLEIDWPDYVDDARSAIESMREPAPGMSIAGVKAMSAAMPDGYVASAAIFGQPKDVWQGMIDAALKGEPSDSEVKS